MSTTGDISVMLEASIRDFTTLDTAPPGAMHAWYWTYRKEERGTMEVRQDAQLSAVGHGIGNDFAFRKNAREMY
jgi:hypothetical protein